MNILLILLNVISVKMWFYTVESVKSLIPRAADLLSRLPALADKVEQTEKLVSANITALRERIAIAIGEANRVSVTKFS